MSRSVMKQATPERELSRYFDAPSPPPEVLSQMSSLEQSLPPPVTMAKQANIAEHSPPSSTEPQISPDIHAEHPNGSDGWLPTVAEERQHMPEAQTNVPTGAAISPVQSNEPAPAIVATAATTDPARPSRVGSIASRRTGSIKRSGSAFANGAGTTGPAATAEFDQDLESRRADAQRNLTPKQRSKVRHEEAKHGKRLSRIIKEEAKTEKKSLALAINELENLQRHQKAAIKSEARVQAAQQTLLTKFKKQEAAYLNAKMAYETSMAQLRTEEETLETLRQNSREATERVQEKAAEVDGLRATLAVDEREREIKLDELKGRTPRKESRSSNFWRGQPA